MEDKQFLSALSSVCENELLSKKDTSLPAHFKFSKGFEQKMREITGGRPVYIRKRLKLALFAAAIFAVGFMLGMARQPKWGYTTRDVDDGMMLTFDVDSVKDPKKSIEEKYTLAGIPDGLEQEKEESSAESWYCHANIWGRFDDPSRGTIDIVFMQFVPAAYRDIFIKDSDTRYLVTEENGIQYFILELGTDDNFKSVIWYQDGYVFLLDAKMSKDDALALCKTLKLEEE